LTWIVTNLDVYTEQGFKAFEEEKKTEERKKDVPEPSSESEGERSPVDVLLFLQGPRGKIKVKVLEVSSALSNLWLTLDGDYQKNRSGLSKSV
jgi:hypothetical protein